VGVSVTVGEGVSVGVCDGVNVKVGDGVAVGVSVGNTVDVNVGSAAPVSASAVWAAFSDVAHPINKKVNIVIAIIYLIAVIPGEIVYLIFVTIQLMGSSGVQKK
jgi:hypothetical protein